MKLANNGSFSLTAKELFLTQPTVSAHIQSLEEELEVKLFSRNTKGTQLTVDGKKLYLYVREMMLILDNIKAEFKKTEDVTVKSIEIASSSVPASYILPEIISHFSKQYPNAQFNVKETDSAGVIKEIINKTVDVGFTGTILDKKNCTYVPFYEDRLVVVMPNTEEYRAICEKGDDFSWIKDSSIIMREEGSGTRKEAEKLLKRYVKDLSELNIIAKMDNTDSIIRSVQNGLGISVVSALAAKDHADSDRLLIYPKDLAKRKFYLVYNSALPVSGSIKALIALVHSLYKIK